jgi:predicted ATPase with chaperone activity
MTTSPGGGLMASRTVPARVAGDTESVLDHPVAPLSLAEAGLSLDLVLQLVLKTLYMSGDLIGTELGRRLGLRFSVIESALAELREARHVEVSSGSMLGPSSYEYRILDAGRARAMLFLQQNQYVGVAPVPLAQYADYLRAHQAAVPRSATRERVREACRHLVLSDRVIDSLGPAVNAGHSLFVYGPPGNGKTVIAQSIRNLLDGDVAVPHAIAVEGQVIRIFDPVVHEPIPTPESDSLIAAGPAEDHRWVRCRRPLVTVGGELTLDALELTYMPVAGFYRAPLQALANGGVLVIDDFGRQRVGPRDLLNRWIVPLESRVDYLTLQTGQKFELPFVTLVAFATNIRPRDLVDEAFLRRIRYKVFAESPSADDYATIWAGACAERGIAFDRPLVERVLAECYRPRRMSLRGCHPRDLIDQALSLAEYRGETPRLTFTLLATACDSYFVDDAEN